MMEISVPHPKLELGHLRCKQAPQVTDACQDFLTALNQLEAGDDWS